MELTDIEKDVLIGLLEHPSHSDLHLSRTISVSRQIITRLRKQFEDSGLIRSVRIPNLSNLGADILIFFHAELNPHIPIAEQQAAVNTYLSDGRIIFFMASESDVIALCVTESFRQSKQMIMDVVSDGKRNHFFRKEPEMLYISISKMRIWMEHTYGRIIRNLLRS